MEQEQSQQEQEERHLTESYDDDLANVMNVTDASVVQELLNDARNRESLVVIEEKEKEERKWYSRTSLIIFFLTLGVIAYGVYYYHHLTVPVQPAASVGVFQNSSPIVASSTNLASVLATYTSSTTLPPNKPELIDLISDSKTNTLLTNSQFYSFIGANVPEPLQGVITAARLGVVNINNAVYPFVIMSVSDPVNASKQFGAAESTLLQMFSPALNVDTSVEQRTVGLNFQSQYFYNLPVRVMENIDPTTGNQYPVFLYGYATNNVIVITSQPQVLDAVYNAIISQQ
jgi:hypothetical protein